ncbi:MAG: hypothetical protein HKN68_17215 [Saprospiraceae bacterium]|nr:hypothetical protein [Saprospiraceae bacterium]
MADATKTSYQKKMISTWSKNIEGKNQLNEKSEFRLSKNMVMGFLGIAFMTLWLILSIHNEQLLLGEIIPAYIIITALLFMRALDNSNV